MQVFFQDKVSSDSESIQTRAEAVMLLKQLDFPVCNSDFSNHLLLKHCPAIFLIVYHVNVV